MITIIPIEVNSVINKTDDVTVQQRWDICEQCDRFSIYENVDEGKEFCSSCNCILATKIMVAEATCPEGKW